MANDYDKNVLGDGTNVWTCLKCSTQIQSRTKPNPRSHHCLGLNTPVGRPPAQNGPPGFVAPSHTPIPSPYLTLPMFGGHSFTPTDPYPRTA